MIAEGKKDKLSQIINRGIECFPNKGIQNARVFVSNISDISVYTGINANEQQKWGIGGAGTGKTAEEAKFLSDMEAVERIANSSSCSQVIIASGNELGEMAINMDLFPRCSKYERTPNQIYDPRKYLKWVRSVNLTRGTVCYIPQEYITLFSKVEFGGENITNPISTGCAIHNNYDEAIINGIYEVIERDSIALTWLLKLPLKQIRTDGLIENVFDNDFLGNTYLYDASTFDDTFVTYCLRAEANNAKHIKNLLMFASHSDPYKALSKLRKELISVMYSLNNQVNKNVTNDAPVDYKNFFSVFDGAIYMASPQREDAFNFLIDNGYTELRNGKTFSSPKDELNCLIDTLKRDGHEVYAADLTTRECRELELYAVKIIIPTLQPISFVYRARYLDSKRIKDYAKKAFGKYEESMINELPLAFA